MTYDEKFKEARESAAEMLKKVIAGKENNNPLKESDFVNERETLLRFFTVFKNKNCSFDFFTYAVTSLAIFIVLQTVNSGFGGVVATLIIAVLAYFFNTKVCKIDYINNMFVSVTDNKTRDLLFKILFDVKDYKVTFNVVFFTIVTTISCVLSYLYYLYNKDITLGIIASMLLSLLFNVQIFHVKVKN